MRRTRERDEMEGSRGHGRGGRFVVLCDARM